jgi:predicted Zn-dependent protease
LRASCTATRTTSTIPCWSSTSRASGSPCWLAARQRGELSAELDQRFAWEIFLGKDRSINAFALPGGYLGLHLGLVGAVANRDELASVLAHELSHVTQRHISRLMTQQNRQTPWLIGAMILGAIAASKNPDAANAVARAARRWRCKTSSISRATWSARPTASATA